MLENSIFALFCCVALRSLVTGENTLLTVDRYLMSLSDISAETPGQFIDPLVTVASTGKGGDEPLPSSMLRVLILSTPLICITLALRCLRNKTTSVA